MRGETTRPFPIFALTSSAGAGLRARRFNVWDSGEYTERGDDYERGAAGQRHEPRPIMDAHGRGGGC